MPEYLVRVVFELKELNVKLIGLGEFITTTSTFDDLSTAEQQRLKRQYKIMELYADVLEERIAAFQGE